MLSLELEQNPDLLAQGKGTLELTPPSLALGTLRRDRRAILIARHRYSYLYHAPPAAFGVCPDRRRLIPQAARLARGGSLHRPEKPKLRDVRAA